MASDVQFALGFRAYQGDKQHVLLELILVNVGNDEAINVTFDIWPDEGEPQSVQAASIPGRSIFRPGRLLDLGREMPVTVSVWGFWETREGESLQGESRLAVGVAEGQIKVSPGGSPLVELVEAHGISLGSLSTDFSVVPLEETGDEELESGSQVIALDSEAEPRGQKATDAAAIEPGDSVPEGAMFEAEEQGTEPEVSMPEGAMFEAEDMGSFEERPTSTTEAEPQGQKATDEQGIEPEEYRPTSTTVGSMREEDEFEEHPTSTTEGLDLEDSDITIERMTSHVQSEESVSSAGMKSRKQKATRLAHMEPQDSMPEGAMLEADSTRKIQAIEPHDSMPEAPMFAPPMPAPRMAPRPAAPKKPVTEEHHRWTDVEFPAEVPLNEWNDLSLAIILKERVLEDGRVVQVARPHTHDEALILERRAGEVMVVDVLLSAPGYKVDGNPFARIEVPHNADSERIGFRLCAMETGRKPIAIHFYQNKRYIGTVRLDVHVLEEGQESSEQHAEFTAKLDFSKVEEAPDLTLNVFERPLPDGTTEFRFLLISKLDEFHFQDGGSVLLRRDPAQWVDQSLASIEQLLERPGTRNLAEERIAAIGYDLYDQLFPPALKELFWSFHERIQSMMVVSEEPWIPWEMVRPFRRTNGEQEAKRHLCEEYMFSRWLAGQPAPARLNADVGKIVAVEAAPEGPRVRDIHVQQRPPAPLPHPESHGDLPAVGKELDMFRSLKRYQLDVGELPSRLSTLLDAFDSGGFDILHFACHGAYNRISPDHSRLQLTDGTLCPEDLTGPRTKFAEKHPLVFLNACHSGRIGHALTRIGSWASRFVQSGCGAFIGSFWAVEDDRAYEFAEAFYEGLFTGLPAGEAFRRARQRIKRPDSTTWMAFCLYADPHATLTTASRPRLMEKETGPTTADEAQAKSAEDRFDELLCRRKLREARHVLLEISHPQRAARCKKRWRWAAGNEVASRTRKARRFLLKARTHRAVEIVNDLTNLVRLAPGLDREASPEQSELGAAVLQMAIKALPMVDMCRMCSACAALSGVRPDIQEKLRIWHRALKDTIETLDRVNTEPPTGLLARGKHKRQVWKAVDGLDKKWNLNEAWVVYSLMSQIDRWPNVLKTLHPKTFAEKEPVFHTNRGLRLLGEGKHREAAKEFREAIRLKPDLAAAHNNYAWLHVVSDDPAFANLDEAVQYAQQAVRLSPRPVFFDTLARLERKRGNLDAAIAAMKQAMEKDQIEPDRWADKLDELLTEKEAKYR